MIGSFLYVSRPRPDDVTVWLQPGGDDAGTRARILLPPRLSAMMIDQNYPPPAPVLSIESALSYGLFLAMRANASLVISGDRALWRPDWGYLTDLGQFPTVGLIAHNDRAPGD